METSERAPGLASRCARIFLERSMAEEDLRRFLQNFDRYQRSAPRNGVSDALEEVNDLEGLDEEIAHALYEHELRLEREEERS